MDRLLQTWVTQQADVRPGDAAIVSGADTLTYGQLETASNQLAHLLQTAGCQNGDRVCILMPKSPEAIVSMIGILKAGAMHVPIDVATPAARIRHIFDSCENRIIIAGGRVVPLLDELMSDESLRSRTTIIWLENLAGVAPDATSAAEVPFAPEAKNFKITFSARDLKSAPSTPLPQHRAASDGSHILFTSGSTGVPKGVVITHSNVSTFVGWALKHYGIGHTDRFSGHTPFHFDLSTFDIFGSITAGAQLHLVPSETALLPPKLAEFIRASKLTQWFSVPSVLNYMAKFNSVQQNDFPDLRRVLWCGEVLPTPALIYWMERLPKVHFSNLYGPTEATIASSYYDVTTCPTDPKSQIPIGTPCDGEDLLVLDDKLALLPVREIGDLYISGAGLSPGYWRDPAKTAAAFIQDPTAPHDSTRRLYRTGDLAFRDDHGLVNFVGRADTQIKVRGYRIELGEIETALNSMTRLQECAVVAIPTDNFGGYMICAAYVVRSGEQATLGDLREHLKKLVPNYMMPARWTAYEALPKNANGKIDRPRLKDAFARNETDGKGEIQAEGQAKSPSTSTPATEPSFPPDTRSSRV
ncbi:MAG TPA: amino acid adenylation domain-containing protein [Candidatus Acidoferrum sp.]|nr:amino acid adenylation domain-containing protein [Candidatus Acidoferrum sp.]